MSLEVLYSDLLGNVTHGFFTRKGGVSSGVFEGLNCGPGSSDQSEAVATNRGRVTEAMGGPIRGVHQVHSADVVVVDGPLPDPQPKADALVSNTEGQVLTVLTADCQPVLFFDQANGVIGAAHAGWKGTVSGVLEATVDAMETLGGDRDTIRAAIGPSISQRAYEVGQDFLETFEAKDPSALAFFANGEDGKYQFNLPGYGLRRLEEAGVQAEWIGHCTYCDSDRFFSYRRTTHAKEADYGRLISAIRL